MEEEIKLSARRRMEVCVIMTIEQGKGVKKIRDQKFLPTKKQQKNEIFQVSVPTQKYNTNINITQFITPLNCYLKPCGTKF